MLDYIDFNKKKRNQSQSRHFKSRL